MDVVRRFLFKKGTRHFSKFNCFPGWDARAGKQLHTWVRGTEHFSQHCQSRRVSNAVRVVGANISANIPHVCLLVSETQEDIQENCIGRKIWLLFSTIFVRYIFICYKLRKLGSICSHDAPRTS